MTPVIFGIAGESVNAEERALFLDADPAGYILFKRNISSRDQVRRLTDDLRSLSGRELLPVLVDQEGGRVARLQPPEWPAFPSGAKFDVLYQRAPMTALAAARHNAEALALALVDVGISVNCAPVLDLRYDATHTAIRDRVFGSTAAQVASLGRAVLDGFTAGGVVGVLKHCPGQGRATLDSHHDLPRVEATSAALAEDMAPFKSLASAPMMMTGHVVYSAWDIENPATLSKTVISEVIRKEIGFAGLLFSDDLTMDALRGTASERILGALAAGCDIGLHCSADLREMRAVFADLPNISNESEQRLNAAMSGYRPSADVSRLTTLIDARDALLAVAA